LTREVLYTKIAEIEDEVLDMGTLCIDAIDEAIEAFKNHDLELAKKIRENDDVIDVKEIEIEEKCVSIIALQQPVASDLRTILSVIKIISKLEKIGDHASRIAKITLNSEDTDMSIFKNNETIQVMADCTKLLLKDALISFKTRNENLARKTYKKSKKIDKLFNELYRSMLSYIIENPKYTSLATSTIFVGESLKIIGDLIGSICDRTVYMITGERIKEEELEKKIQLDNINN